MTWVFSFQELEPKVVLWIVIEKPPPPLGHQGLVHKSNIRNAQTALVFGLADILPCHKMILALVPLPFREEPTSVLVHSFQDTLQEQKQTHRVNR